MSSDISNSKLNAPDTKTIRQELVSAGFGSAGLHLFSQLDSTSVWLRGQADSLLMDTIETTGTDADAGSGSDAGSPKPDSYLGLSPAQLCATHWQSSGIARRGKNWQTKPGNITFSLLSETLRKPNELLGLSLVTGIGVATCLARECGVVPQLKWPNDVILNEAKIGGLLTELMATQTNDSQAASTRILTGIGINFLHDEEVQSLGIGATSLEAAGGQSGRQNRDTLLGKLAGSVLAAHQQFLEEGWAPFATQWRTFDWLLDKTITIHTNGSVEYAIARGVDQQGALLVEKDGELQSLYGGEVSIRPVV